jgi:hypothetical protein
MCFYSHVFGLEKKIIVPLSVIKAVDKANTALVIPNAIKIQTARKQYIFRSFWDRDQAFEKIDTQMKIVKGVIVPAATPVAPAPTTATATATATAVDSSAVDSSAVSVGARRQSSSTNSETSEVDSERGDGHGEELVDEEVRVRVMSMFIPCVHEFIRRPDREYYNSFLLLPFHRIPQHVCVCSHTM